MKVIRKDVILESEAIESIIKERMVLIDVEHPFMVGMKYGFSTEERLFFVMDYIKGGELYEHLKDNTRFPEEQAKFYIANIAMGIGHLHSKNLIHRDLKPENILIGDDGYLLISDFGLTKELQKDGEEAKGSFCGTLDYMSLEIL